MPTICSSLDLGAPLDAAWELLADYGNIQRWNPNLSASQHTGGPLCDVGSTRRCDLADGKNHIVERLVDLQPGRAYTVEVVSGTMPIVDTRVTLFLTPLAGGGSCATVTMSYRPKPGPIWWLVERLLLRPMMSRLLGKLLRGLARESARVSRVVPLSGHVQLQSSPPGLGKRG